MPTTVELQDGTELEFPDGMDEMAMRQAISKSFPQFAKPLPSESAAVLAPGESQSGAFGRPQTSALTQAFPVQGQQMADAAAQEDARVQMMEQRAAEARPAPGVESVEYTPRQIEPIKLPNVGEPGTFTGEASRVVTGLGEWALNKPEEILLAMTPWGGAALAARYGPDVAKQLVEDTPLAIKGDQGAQGRIFGVLATVAAPVAAKGGARAIGRAMDETAVQRAEARAVDQAARESVPPLTQEAPTLLKRADAELQAMKTGTDPATFQTVNAPDRGEMRQIRKQQAPVVPETPPEAQRGLSVLEEIRQANADTTAKVQKLYPQLKREEAAALRRQAFPVERRPDNLSRSDVDRLFLDELNKRSDEEIAAAERKPDAIPKRETEGVPVEEPPRGSPEVVQEIRQQTRPDDAPAKEAPPEAQRDVIAEPVVTAKVEAGSPRRGEIGGMLSSGEVVTTSSGRSTTPFPKISTGTNRKTIATVKQVDAWLRENALEEAVSRGDDFNSTQFRNANPKKLTKAEKDSMEQYLFGEQPAVPKPFLNPLSKPAAPAQAAAKVEAEVKSVARTEGARPAKEVKSELVERLEKAVEDAPFTTEEYFPGLYVYEARTLSETTRLTDRPVEGTRPLKDWLESPKTKKDKTPNRDTAMGVKFIAEALERKKVGKVTIRIPGDGDFTVWNTKDAIGTVLKRAQRISTSTEAPRGFTESKPTKEQGKAWAEEAKVEPPSASEPQGASGIPPLTPSTAANVTHPVKGLHQITQDLAKGLDIPIRFGRLTTSKFAGYFKQVQNLIGSKKAVDMSTVSHEVGHKLDSKLKLSSDATLAAELDVLGDPATPGSGSSWTPKKSRAYKMGEGVGEFVRYWMTDPVAAKAKAPNTFSAFEKALDANPDWADVMRRAQNDIGVWRTSQSQARLRSHLSVGENPNGTPYRLRQATRDLVDDLHILRIASDDAGRMRGSPLRPTENPYVLARLLRGGFGLADTFVRQGVVDFKTKGVKMGTSLEDALKPVSGQMDNFRDWIVAKRAQELHGQGRQTGLIPADADAVAKLYDSVPEFQEAFRKVKEWQDAVLQYGVDAGFITPEGATAMRKLNADYVPMHRLFEIGAGEMASQESVGLGRGLNVGKPSSLKTLKGSVRPIVDPIETMVKNAYVLTTAAEKGFIHSKVAALADSPGMGKWVERIATPKQMERVTLEKIRKQLEDAGADLTAVPDDLLLSFYKDSRTAPFGENIIRVIRDGKPEFYRLNRDLFDTFHALDMEDGGKIIRLLSAPANVLRAGVTLAPDFALANTIRDAFSSAVVSRFGLLPFEGVIRGVAAMVGDKKLVAEWKAAGGKHSIEANYFDRQKLQQFVRERVTKDLTAKERALIYAKSPLTALRQISGFAEEATRIGEYQVAYNKLRKAGMPEGDARAMAAFESRDRQDFAKGGAKTKAIRMMSAFWNAALQGNVKLAQSFRERPVQTMLKGMAFVTIPKLLEQALNYDDPDYWDRPQWERDLFFLFPIGKDQNNRTQFARLPTPFEVGIIFGTLPGRMIQVMKEKGDLSGFKGFANTVLQATVPNPIPNTLQAVFENFLSGKKGWDIFRGRQIVPESLADLPADMQWTEQTSLTAKKLGAALGFSPMKIDHLIAQTTGGLGRQLVHNVSDRGISLVTGDRITAKNRLPGGRFVTAPAGILSQSVEDFYKNLSKLEGESQRLKLTGKAEAWVVLAPAFRSASQSFSELRKQARQTQNSAEKQKIQLRIRDAAQRMNFIAKQQGLD